ncbi:MAG TPA: GNAT family N-acetyltransferase [Oceanospirillaceae bacterium]|nr:GNAT family N-acetyltransferase [Oceanospirillaceae bacterium]
MINLKPILASQFPDYRSYFVSDYSQELIQNYAYSATTATEIAATDLEQSFPNGISTNQHQLMCITHAQDDSWLGYLWYSTNTDTSVTFIYDLYVAPEFRSLGYGSLSLAQLEHQVKQQGISEVKLRVAYSNHQALELYKRMGFNITGYNMSKKLK